MIIVTHKYTSINEPQMSDNFIIRMDKVLKVWDITDGEIGIRFISNYDKYDYRIRLEEGSKKLLAKDLTNWIKLGGEFEIEGDTKIK